MRVAADLGGPAAYMRIAMGIEYDGSRFSGWQRQPHAASVQAVIERALAQVADHPVDVVCAGRTDAGVHATAQVVHFDATAVRSLRGWMLGTNSNLPPEVCVTWVQQAEPDFHARFSAIGRQYRYIILNRSMRPALLRDRVSWDYRPLDAARMAEAGRALVGEHDFSSFRALACQAKHPVREIYSLEVHRSGDFIYLDVAANAFLHHMVRNIAGTLMAVGCDDRPVEWVAEVLAERDRARGGVTAPAAGLYLVQVRYPARFAVFQTAQLPSLG